MLAVTAALFARSWLQTELHADGLQRDHAADLSFLVVSPILLLLLFPVLRSDKGFLLDLFRRDAITLRMVTTAILIGVLVRLTWWSQLVAGISFGVYRSDYPLALEGPRFAFQCDAPGIVALGFLVMAVLVPAVEELSHRGYVQTALSHHGPLVAIAISAAVFTVFHRPGNWYFIFFAGVVFGAQYWSARSLWPSMITHATINGLIQVDWRCLNGQWNPPASDLPLWQFGIPALLTLVLSVVLTGWLALGRNNRGGDPPRR